jgi:hypothetical protein
VVGRAHRMSLSFFVPGVTTSSGEPDVANLCSNAARKCVRTEFDLLGRPVKVTERCPPTLSSWVGVSCEIRRAEPPKEIPPLRSSDT